MLIWIAIPQPRSSKRISAKIILRLIIIFQFLLRLILTVLLTSQIIKATGVVMETTWTGAAYYLMLYMLVSHVIGSCWYLLAFERQEQCWKKVCDLQRSDFLYHFFDCSSINSPGREA